MEVKEINSVTTSRAANLGLSDSTRHAVGKILNVTLADLYALQLKTKNFHWNIQSMRFKSLHELFEEQYDEMAESIDEAAERALMIGIAAAGSMEEFLKMCRLEENTMRGLSAEQMVEELLETQEQFIRNLRKDLDRVLELGDEGTGDFLTALLRDHEGMAWMLRAHLVDQ